MSHNNYKKMIFQQTINWLTDLISHNLLCKLVYWLCYLSKSESYPLLLGCFLNEGCTQRFIRGNWRAIRFWRQWTEPLNQNEMIRSTTSWNPLLETGFGYKGLLANDIERQRTKRLPRAPSAARRTNSYKQERHLVRLLKFLAKNLNWIGRTEHG